MFRDFFWPCQKATRIPIARWRPKREIISSHWAPSRLPKTGEDDVKDGKHTDFRMAVKAADDEKIVFSWIVWPDRETCDAAAKKMESSDMPGPAEMPFDGKRMIWGGFSPIYSMGR